MKNVNASIIVLFMLLLSSAAAPNTLNKNFSTLITADSAGEIRIGMTLAEAKRAMGNAEFVRSSDGEGLALIDVNIGDENMMTLYAGEEDSESSIDQNAKIEYIEVWNEAFKTAEGVHPKMKVSDAEKIYGTVDEVFMSEIESREFVNFLNHPKGLTIRLLAEDGDAGVYAEGSRNTAKYSAGAYIFSISLSGSSEED